MSDGIICAEQNCTAEAEIEVVRCGIDPKDKSEAVIWLCSKHYEKLFGRERLALKTHWRIERMIGEMKATLPGKYQWALAARLEDKEK
jgi:hypothetical protein